MAYTNLSWLENSCKHTPRGTRADKLSILLMLSDKGLPHPGLHISRCLAYMFWHQSDPELKKWMKNNHWIIITDHRTGDSKGNENEPPCYCMFEWLWFCEVAFALVLTAKQRPLISAYRANQGWNFSLSWCIEHMIMLIVWVMWGEKRMLNISAQMKD